jgi:asparagine synthase (glutamine-hydrolysing)
VGALAVRAAGAGLKTFSIGYDTGDVAETGPAQVAARAIGSEHHELVLSEAAVAVRAPAALSRLDQPLADPAFVALNALSEFARTEVRVAVGGEGADELFGGYPRYAWLTRIARASDRSRWTSSGAETVKGLLPGRAGRLAAALAAPDAFRAHLDWVTTGRGALDALYGPRLRDTLETEGHVATLRSLVDDSDGDVAGALMRLDQLVWLPDDVLVKTDRASMLASLELRTPYLSFDLAEFAATIPTAMHVSGHGKRLLREVLRRELPEADHRRRKIAFRVPTPEWLRGPLAYALETQLGEGRLYDDGWLDRAAVTDLVRRHRAGADCSSALWPIFAFGVWLDGSGSVYG